MSRNELEQAGQLRVENFILSREHSYAVPDRLILLDLNRTVLDENDKLDGQNEDTLRRAIEAAQKEGIAVGLNSDSPLPPLYRLAIRLGMNGPILAENGTLYFDAETEKAHILNEIPDIQTVRKQQTAALTDQGITIFPARIATEFNEPNDYSGQPGERGIAQGKYRVCTSTYFGLRLNDQGTMYLPDANIATTATNILKKTLPPTGCVLYQDLADGVAYIAIHPLYPGQSTYRPNKALGAAIVLEQNPHAKLLKIGDDERDLRYGYGEGRIFTGMVGNAQNSNKEEADLVAQHPYALGAAELIFKGIPLLK